jgi:putative membrane protein
MIYIGRRIFLLPGMIAMALITQQCGIGDKDKVNSTERPVTPIGVSEDVSDFLMEAADARLMDIEQGKLAASRGSTKAIRHYGEWILNDQRKLLKELEAVANKKGVTLPKSISSKRMDELTKLKKEEGLDFDKKFYRMMKRDYKRDLQDFKRASKSDDAEIALFASQYTPTIEEQLDKLKDVNPSPADL